MPSVALMRATGALLALSTIVNGVWFAVSGDGDLSRVRLGVAGALAVGLLWAARAGSERRSILRSAGVSVVVLLGCVAALLAFVDIAGHQTPFSSLFDWLAPADEAVPEEFALTPELAIDPSTALSWAVMLASVCVAAAIGPVAWRRAVTGERLGEARWLLVPFVGLVVGSLADQAFVAAGLAVLAAVWLDRALAASAPTAGSAP